MFILLVTTFIILLVASTVHSSTDLQASLEVSSGPKPRYVPPLPFDNCLNFEGYWEAPSGPDAYKYNARFWVNDTVICSADKVEVDPEEFWPKNPWVYMTCYTCWYCRYLLLLPQLPNGITIEYGTPYCPWDYGGGFVAKWEDESQKYLGCKRWSCDGTPFECFEDNWPSNSVVQEFQLSPES